MGNQKVGCSLNDSYINEDWGCYKGSNGRHRKCSSCSGKLTAATGFDEDSCCISNYPQSGFGGPDWYGGYDSSWSDISEYPQSHLKFQLQIKYTWSAGTTGWITQPSIDIDGGGGMTWNHDDPGVTEGPPPSFCGGWNGVNDDIPPMENSELNIYKDRGIYNKIDCMKSGNTWYSKSPYDIPVVGVFGNWLEPSQLDENGCTSEHCTNIKGILPKFKSSTGQVVPPLYFPTGDNDGEDLFDDSNSQYPRYTDDGELIYHIPFYFSTSGNYGAPVKFKMWDPVTDKIYTIGCWNDAKSNNFWMTGPYDPESTEGVDIPIIQVEINIDNPEDTFSVTGCTDTESDICNFNPCATSPCNGNNSCCTYHISDDDGHTCSECSSDGGDSILLKYYLDTDGDGIGCGDDLPKISCPDNTDFITELEDMGYILITDPNTQLEYAGYCDCYGDIDSCEVCGGGSDNTIQYWGTSIESYYSTFDGCLLENVQCYEHECNWMESNSYYDCNCDCNGDKVINYCGLCDDQGINNNLTWCYIDNDEDGEGAGTIGDSFGTWCCTEDSPFGYGGHYYLDDELSNGCKLDSGECPSGYSINNNDNEWYCESGNNSGHYYPTSQDCQGDVDCTSCIISGNTDSCYNDIFDDCGNCTYSNVSNCLMGHDGLCYPDLWSIQLYDQCGVLREPNCTITDDHSVPINSYIDYPPSLPGAPTSSNPCTRCGGGGMYPTNPLWNSTCLDCSGTPCPSLGEDITSELFGEYECDSYDDSGVETSDHCCTLNEQISNKCGEVGLCDGFDLYLIDSRRWPDSDGDGTSGYGDGTYYGYPKQGYCGKVDGWIDGLPPVHLDGVECSNCWCGTFDGGHVVSCDLPVESCSMTDSGGVLIPSGIYCIDDDNYDCITNHTDICGICCNESISGYPDSETGEPDPTVVCVDGWENLTPEDRPCGCKSQMCGDCDDNSSPSQYYLDIDGDGDGSLGPIWSCDGVHECDCLVSTMGDDSDLYACTNEVYDNYFCCHPDTQKHCNDGVENDDGVSGSCTNSNCHDCVENDYIDGMLENDQSCFSIDITPVMINDVGETYTVTSFPYNESQSDYIKFEISVDSEISSDENLIFSNNEEASVTISKGEISVSEDYNIVELENGGLVSFSISYIPVVDGDSVYGNYVATLRYPTGCDGNCVVLKSVAFSIDVAVVGCMDESEDVCNYNSEATYPCTDNECCIHKQTYYSDNDGDGLGCCKNGEYSEYCPDELPETSFEIDLPLNSDGNPINVDVDSHNRYCYDIGYTKTDISLDDLLSDENDTGKLCKSWEGGYWVDTECNDMLEKAVCEMYPYVTDVEIGCYSEDPGEDFIAGMCECEFNTFDDCGACLDAKCLPISDFQSEGDLYDLILDTYLVNPTNGLFYVVNPCYNGEVVTNANWNLNCTGCGRSDSSNYNSSFDNSSDGIHCKGIGGDGEIGSYNELLSIGQLCMGHCSNKSSVKCWTNSDCIYNDISLGDCYYDLPGWGNQGNSCCCDIKSGCIDPEDPNYNSSAILDCDGELAAYCLFSKYLIGPSLNDSISGNETSIYLSSTETLNKNEYLKIDNEVVLINSVYSNRIEVTRGVVGTDSESHAGGTVTVEERGSCSYTIGLDEYDQSCCVGYTKYACTDPNAKNYYCFGGVDNRINDMTRCDELEIPATGTRHYDVVKCNSDLYGNGILDSANGFPGGNCGKHYFGRMEEDIAPNWIKQDGVVNNFQAQSIGQFPSNTCVNITEMAVDTSIDNINGCGFGYNFNERFGENNWTSTVELIDDSPIPELSKALKIEIDTYDLLCGATDQSDCGVGGLYISNNYSDMGNSHYYMWVKVVSGNINIGFNDTDNMVTHGVTDGWEIISSMDALTASYNSDIFDISVDATGGGVEVYILEYGLYESYTGGAGTDCCCEYEYDCYGKRILTTDWNFNDNSCTGNSGPCADYDNCGICSGGADAYDTVIVANSDNYGCGCFRGPPPIWHKDSDFDGTGCDCLTSGCITYPSGESVDYGYGASWQNCLLHQLPVFDVAGDVNQFVKNYPFGYLPIVHTQFYNLGEDIWNEDCGYEFDICGVCDGDGSSCFMATSDDIDSYAVMPPCSGCLWWGVTGNISHPYLNEQLCRDHHPNPNDCVCREYEDCNYNDNGYPIGSGECMIYSNRCTSPISVSLLESADACVCYYEFYDCNGACIDPLSIDSRYVPYFDLQLSRGGNDRCGDCYGNSFHGDHLAKYNEENSNCNFDKTKWEYEFDDNGNRVGAIFNGDPLVDSTYDCHCTCKSTYDLLPNGPAFIDECGECVGGLTHMPPRWNLDSCGICGGHSWIIPLYDPFVSVESFNSESFIDDDIKIKEKPSYSINNILKVTRDNTTCKTMKKVDKEFISKLGNVIKEIGYDCTVVDDSNIQVFDGKTKIPLGNVDSQSNLDLIECNIVYWNGGGECILGDYGCTDPLACNYNPYADNEDDSCVYPSHICEDYTYYGGEVVCSHLNCYKSMAYCNSGENSGMHYESYEMCLFDDKCTTCIYNTPGWSIISPIETDELHSYLCLFNGDIISHEDYCTGQDGIADCCNGCRACVYLGNAGVDHAKVQYGDYVETGDKWCNHDYINSNLGCDCQCGSGWEMDVCDVCGGDGYLCRGCNDSDEVGTLNCHKHYEMCTSGCAAPGNSYDGPNGTTLTCSDDFIGCIRKYDQSGIEYNYQYTWGHNIGCNGFRDFSATNNCSTDCCLYDIECTPTFGPRYQKHCNHMHGWHDGEYLHNGSFYNITLNPLVWGIDNEETNTEIFRSDLLHPNEEGPVPDDFEELVWGFSVDNWHTYYQCIDYTNQCTTDFSQPWGGGYKPACCSQYFCGTNLAKKSIWPYNILQEYQYTGSGGFCAKCDYSNRPIIELTHRGGSQSDVYNMPDRSCHDNDDCLDVPGDYNCCSLHGNRYNFYKCNKQENCYVYSESYYGASINDDVNDGVHPIDDPMSFVSYGEPRNLGYYSNSSCENGNYETFIPDGGVNTIDDGSLQCSGACMPSLFFWNPPIWTCTDGNSKLNIYKIFQHCVDDSECNACEYINNNDQSDGCNNPYNCVYFPGDGYSYRTNDLCNNSTNILDSNNGCDHMICCEHTSGCYNYKHLNIANTTFTDGFSTFDECLQYDILVNSSPSVCENGIESTCCFNHGIDIDGEDDMSNILQWPDGWPSLDYDECMCNRKVVVPNDWNYNMLYDASRDCRLKHDIWNNAHPSYNFYGYNYGDYDVICGDVDSELTVGKWGWHHLPYNSIDGDQYTYGCSYWNIVIDDDSDNIYDPNFTCSPLSSNGSILTDCLDSPIWGGMLIYLGCNDPLADNYNTVVIFDDGSCIYSDGCTDPNAINYDPDVGVDDGSCCYSCYACYGDVPMVEIFSECYVISNTTSIIKSGLSGSIPPEICDLVNLTNISLTGNYYDQLDGEIPECISGLDLTTLNLADNNFTGKIPQWIGDISTLITLDLKNNNFYGTVPDNIGELLDLSTLSLSNNELIGSIPSWVVDLSTLTDLYLDGNNFGCYEYDGSICLTHCNDTIGEECSAQIPEDIDNLSDNFKHLLLNNNYLTGELPDSLWNLNGISTLRLEHNQLTGYISEHIGNLTNLIWLGLSNNQFYGELPHTLWNIETDMFLLDLSDNQFSGQLSENICGAFVRWNSIVDANFEKNQLCFNTLSCYGDIEDSDKWFISDQDIAIDDEMCQCLYAQTYVNDYCLNNCDSHEACDECVNGCLININDYTEESEISEDVGYMLKSVEHWEFGAGGDVFGFGALPGGELSSHDSGNYDSNFKNMNLKAAFWTSTQHSSGYVYAIALSGFDDNDNDLHIGAVSRYSGRYIRCINEIGTEVNESPTNNPGGDEYTYETVLMPDNRTWFAENLRETTTSDGDGIDDMWHGVWCTPMLYSGGQCDNTSDDDIQNYYDMFGYLYIIGDPSPEMLNICPIGYHIPSNEEWEEMLRSLGSCDDCDDDDDENRYCHSSGVCVLYDESFCSDNIYGLSCGIGDGICSEPGTLIEECGEGVYCGYNNCNYNGVVVNCCCYPIECQEGQCGEIDSGCGGGLITACGTCDGILEYCDESSNMCTPCNDSTDNCCEGYIPNCDPDYVNTDPERNTKQCCPESYVGDEICDGITQPYGCDMTCYGLDPDGNVIGSPTDPVSEDLSDGLDCVCIPITPDECHPQWCGPHYDPGEMCDGVVVDCGDDCPEGTFCNDSFGGSCNCGFDSESCCDGFVSNCDPDYVNKDPEEETSQCCPISWIADGWCDDEDQPFGCNLTCYTCTEYDENGTCISSEYNEDGGNEYCDCISPYWVDETWGYLDYDNCCKDWVQNCGYPDNSSLPCCPKDWIGDGDCDERGTTGCDLTCYGLDPDGNIIGSPDNPVTEGHDGGDCTCDDSCEDNMCGVYDTGCGDEKDCGGCPDGYWCNSDYPTLDDYPGVCESCPSLTEDDCFPDGFYPYCGEVELIYQYGDCSGVIDCGGCIDPIFPCIDNVCYPCNDGVDNCCDDYIPNCDYDWNSRSSQCCREDYIGDDYCDDDREFRGCDLSCYSKEPDGTNCQIDGGGGNVTSGLPQCSEENTGPDGGDCIFNTCGELQEDEWGDGACSYCTSCEYVAQEIGEYLWAGEYLCCDYFSEMIIEQYGGWPDPSTNGPCEWMEIYDWTGQYDGGVCAGCLCPYG